MTLPGIPSPVIDDPDTAGFWAATREHRLVVRSCLGCRTDLHMPRAHCRHCGSWKTWWRPVAGRGRLYSWTVTEREIHPGFPPPFTVVLVELDDAPSVRLVGTIPGRPHLEAGQPMTVSWSRLADGTVLPQWVPEKAGDHGYL